MSYGDTWSNANNSTGNITGLCMSSDGQKMMAVSTTTATNCQISIDGGVGWTLGGTGQVGAYGCACSADFSRLYIAHYGNVSRSLDGGQTFQSVVTGSSMQTLACSADGMIVYQGSSGGTTGQMFRQSTDGGDTWSFIDPTHTGAHYKISCSASGQYAIVGIQTAPYGLKTNDYGATWTNLTLAASTGQSAISADGQHQYMAHPLSSTTWLEQSHDYGVTWTSSPIGGSGSSSVCCSADGRYVVVSGGMLNGTYASTDFGEHWYLLSTGLSNSCYWLACSASGQKIGATTNVRVATCDTSLLSIISIDPASGPIAGGTPVTIIGTGFESGAVATVGGLALSGQSVVDSYTITGSTQAHAAGAVDVTVTNP